jgi:hypothetical protein
VNGCVFYNAQAAQICDNAQPGWTKDYNATSEIICASGVPKEKLKIKAEK